MQEIYILERRNTVGSYRPFAWCYSLDNAKAIFEEAKKNEGFNNSSNLRLEMTSEEKKKYPDVISFAKMGGTHHNIILRIRKEEVAN